MAVHNILVNKDDMCCRRCMLVRGHIIWPGAWICIAVRL